eukprot:31556-Pelagococcus_subviridis.AAC.12
MVYRPSFRTRCAKNFAADTAQPKPVLILDGGKYESTFESTYEYVLARSCTTTYTYYEVSLLAACQRASGVAAERTRAHSYRAEPCGIITRAL